MGRKTQNQEAAVIKNTEQELETSVVAEPPPIEDQSKLIASLMSQAWIGTAVWMSFGLLNEGLIGFRIPAYVADDVRREMFRLAHAHGTLLSLMLLGAAFGIHRLASAPTPAIWALRIGAITMPTGFLLGGIWHFKGDPGLGVWLVTPSALLVIFAAISMALANLRKQK